MAISRFLRSFAAPLNALFVLSILAPMMPQSTFAPLVPTTYAAAPTCDVTLNPGDSIQTAITAASAGDVICLNPGSYPQASTILVDEEVTIIRTGCDPDVITSRTAGDTGSEAIIDGGGSIATIFDLQADNITLACLEVKSATGDMIESQSGVPTSGIVIKNNLIHNATGDEAIQLRNTTNPLIQYNHIYDVAQDAVNVSAGSDGAEIRDNKIHDNSSSNGAIYIYGSTTNTTIDGNLIYDKSSGNDTIKFGDSPDVGVANGGSVTNNVIVGGVQDAISVSMSDITISNNKITTHGSSNGAIYIYDGTNNTTITNNLIKNNTTTGIKIGAGGTTPTNVVFNNNCIEGNTAGVTYADGTPTIDGEDNWWGAVDGPSGPGGTGAGDSVALGIDFDPFNSTSCGIADVIDNNPADGVPDGDDDPLTLPVVIPACDPSNTFDTFSLGSVDGQGSWSATGPFDQAVVNNTYGYSTFGCQSLRISNAVTSGSFGDQTFSFSTIDEAGESIADSNGFSGGTRQNTFEAEFDIAATQSTEQSGLFLSVSPDRGDGSRMSYLSFTDTAGGIDVVFYDVQGTGNPASFVPTTVATGLSRTVPHTIKFEMEFVDGPSNDIVKIYIDNVLVHTGTSWENYYRYDSEQAGNGNKVPTTDSLIFRASGSAETGNSGKGFLFDNVSLSTGSTTPPTPGATCDATDGDDSLLGYWKLDESTGDVAANEVAGGADFELLNNLEVGHDSDTPTVNFDNPYSLFFEGVDDTAEATEALSLPDGGTVSFFFKPGSVSDNAYQYLVNAEYAGGGRITVIQRNGNLWFYWHTGGGPLVSANNVLTGSDVGEWKHVAMVNDNGTLYAYLDGVLLGQNTGAETGITTSRILLGSNITTSNAGFHFTGNLDDIRIYDRVLSEENVGELNGGDCQDTGFLPILDFGDAPDPDYPTLLASDGARHQTSSVYLGSTIDSEDNGQPTSGADGDDTTDSDDEDGVTFSTLMAGEMATGTVVASDTGYLDAWIDFNNDGDWDDAYEHIADDISLSAGSNSVVFPVPTGATVGDTYARFRFASTAIASYTGQEMDGEVEDYVVTITMPFVPVCNGEEATIYVDGNNYIVGGPLDGTMFAGTLTGTSGDDVIVGTSGDDMITGEAGNDLICASDGEDDVNGNQGDDEIYGEGGNDYLRGGQNDDSVYGGPGNDEILGDLGNDYVEGSEGEDTIEGGDGDDELHGGAGNDELQGNTGEDTITGGEGNDNIRGGQDDDDISGNNGDDTIQGDLGNDTITGGDGEDEIYGNAGDDFLCGNNDNDYIEGGDDNDTICGSAGDDELYGNGGTDEIDGGDDDDTVDGGADSDICVNSETTSDCEDTTTPVTLCSDKAACTPDDITLVGYWRLDESQANSTAMDSSTNDNDGTYNGTTQSADTPSAIIYGNMYSREFDGVDDYIDMGDVADMGTSDFTTSLWVKTSDSDGSLISKSRYGADAGRWFTVIEGGTLVAGFDPDGSGDNRATVSAAGITDNAWHHVVTVYDRDGNITVYVDGSAVATSDISSFTGVDMDTSFPLFLGMYQDAAGTGPHATELKLDGNIDDVRIFNRALTEAQVGELYAGECADSGAVSSNALLSVNNTGVQSTRYLKNKLVKSLNNFGNPNFVNAPVAPAGFGGPTSFPGDEWLTWEQLNGICSVRDQIDLLNEYDIVEYMAENFANMYGTSESFIIDILTNGTGCEYVYEARADEKRQEEELVAQKEAERQAELMALYYQYQPETLDFAVAEDGYPVSTDMVWNACIRNIEVFLPGETKPVNCRRFHDGHKWTHPDTHVTFNWSDRILKRIRIRGYDVATYTVPMPDFYVKGMTVIKDKMVTKYVLPLAQYMTKKGSDFLEKLAIKEQTVDLVTGEVTITTAILNNGSDSQTVLSEESTTTAQ